MIMHYNHELKVDWKIHFCEERQCNDCPFTKTRTRRDGFFAGPILSVYDGTAECALERLPEEVSIEIISCLDDVLENPDDTKKATALHCRSMASCGNCMLNGICMNDDIPTLAICAYILKRGAGKYEVMEQITIDELLCFLGGEAS